MNQGGAEVDLGLDHVGAQFENLSIAADGGRIVAVLLRVDRGGKHLVGRGFLREDRASEQGDHNAR